MNYIKLINKLQFLIILLYVSHEYCCKSNVLVNGSTNTDGLNKCFPNLGCFNVTEDFFHSTFRPINLPPSEPKDINTQFLLFTRKNRKESQKLYAPLNVSALIETYYDPKRPTKFIIHGFMDNQEIGLWLNDMKNELLQYDDNNVIIVDWSGGNGLPYSQATANTRVVGAQIALLVNNIMNITHVNSDNFHLIGHSLGAHIAGYAGERIPNLGRISGLDPAEPYFQFMPIKVRLDRSDAKFVDVIHSDSKSILQFGLGMSQTVGHIDFFPNGGEDQPGCAVNRLVSFMTDGLLQGTRQFVACNHQRSIDYFIESIKLYNTNSKCTFLSYKCKNWQIFDSGNCVNDCSKSKDNCALMGIDANGWKKFKDNSRSVRMYLKTNDATPFCEFHYQIQVKMSDQKEKNANAPPYGMMSIKLYGTNSSVHHEQKLSIVGNEIENGAVYTYLVTTVKQLGFISKISLKWEKSINILKPKTWNFNIFGSDTTEIYVNKITVTNLSYDVKSVRNFCINLSRGSIKVKQWADFDKLC